MADKIKRGHEPAPEEAIQSALGRTEAFFMENGKSLLTALTVVVIVVGGFFGYKYLIQAPRAQRASEMMFVAEQQFAVDSFALALNGDGSNAGFLEVVEKYGNTTVGNLAKHYAGICYLKTGEYQSALDYLKQYKAKGEVPGEILTAQNLGLQGDAYVELGNYTEAVKMYEKAVASADNVFTTPVYLKKAGLLYEQLGDNAKALAAYKRIETDYAVSMEGRDIQKFIGRLEQL